MSPARRNYNDVTEERLDFLDDLADSIAREYFAENAKIEPLKIARAYGIHYILGSYEDAFDGALYFADGQFYIFINEDRQQSVERRRFTFCHELGHFFIDGHRTALASGEVPYHSSFTNYSSELSVEREADFFASFLLMPRHRIITDYRQYRKFSFSIIEQFSQKYKTSKIATVYRVLHLDLHPMMVVKAVAGTIVSVLKSADFGFYPRGKKDFIPQDSLMYSVLKGEDVSGKTDQIWIGDWFDAPNREEDKLFEHCIHYPQIDLCYSILWQE